MLVFFPQAKAHEFVKLMSENGHLKSATMDLQVSSHHFKVPLNLIKSIFFCHNF